MEFVAAYAVKDSNLAYEGNSDASSSADHSKACGN
jgi:hypothetical protein